MNYAVLVMASQSAYSQIAAFQRLITSYLIRYNLRFKASVDAPQLEQPNGQWTVRVSVQNRETWDGSTIRFREGALGWGQGQLVAHEVSTRALVNLLHSMRFAGLIDEVDAKKIQEELANPKKAEN